MTPRRTTLSPRTFISKSRTLAFPARPKPTTTIPITPAILISRYIKRNSQRFAWSEPSSLGTAGVMCIFAVCNSTSISTPPSEKLRNNIPFLPYQQLWPLDWLSSRSHVIFVHSSVLFLITHPLTVHFLTVLEQTLLVARFQGLWVSFPCTSIQVRSAFKKCINIIFYLLFFI